MKTSQKLDGSTKKDRKVLPVAAQVYGRASPQKATEIGRFKNAACTFMHVVVDLFTTRFGFPCKTRAQLCQGSSLAKSPAIQRISNAFDRLTFTTGSYAPWAAVGQ